MHFTLEKGATDVTLVSIPKGFLDQDRHFAKLGVALNETAGVDKWVNVTITDCTNNMTVSLTGDQTNGTSTTGAFDLDVSDEDFVIKYTETAGSGAKKCSIIFRYWEKENG